MWVFNRRKSIVVRRDPITRLALCAVNLGPRQEAKWLDFLASAGFDGWEETSSELDLERCADDASAAAYAKERVAEDNDWHVFAGARAALEYTRRADLPPSTAKHDEALQA